MLVRCAYASDGLPLKGLILSGGKGTRLRPITHTGAKQLIPVANRPILFYAIDALTQAGIHDIGIIVGDTADEVRAAVGDGSKFDATVTFIPQEAPLGLAHAVGIARDFLDGDSFVMYLGDNLIAQGIGTLVDEFRRSEADTMILLARVPEPQRFGVAELEDGRVISLVEKPSVPRSDLALVGVYLFSPLIFEAIDAIEPSARGELEITDAIQRMIDTGKSVLPHIIEGWWKDTGRLDDILEANRMILDTLEARCDGVVGEDVRLHGKVVVEEGATLRNCVVRGPAIIGSGTIVDNAYIGPFTSVYFDCVVRNAEIENSIVLEGTRIHDVGGQDRRIADREGMRGLQIAGASNRSAAHARRSFASRALTAIGVTPAAPPFRRVSSAEVPRARSPGQLGGDTVDEGVRQGDEMVGLTQWECDITDAAAVEKAIGDVRPDAVINGAAWTQVDAAEDHEADAEAVNATGAGHVAAACAAAGIRCCQSALTTCSTALRRHRSPRPRWRRHSRRMDAPSCTARAGARALSRPRHRADQLALRAPGTQLRAHHAAPRRRTPAAASRCRSARGTHMDRPSGAGHAPPDRGRTCGDISPHQQRCHNLARPRRRGDTLARTGDGGGTDHDRRIPDARGSSRVLRARQPAHGGSWASRRYPTGTRACRPTSRPSTPADELRSVLRLGLGSLVCADVEQTAHEPGILQEVDELVRRSSGFSDFQNG